METKDIILLFGGMILSLLAIYFKEKILDKIFSRFSQQLRDRKLRKDGAYRTEIENISTNLNYISITRLHAIYLLVYTILLMIIFGCLLTIMFYIVMSLPNNQSYLYTFMGCVVLAVATLAINIIDAEKTFTKSKDAYKMYFKQLDLDRDKGQKN